jgi:nitrilase
VAKEARSFVLSVSGLLRPGDIPASVPHRERIVARGEEFLLNGGSAAAGPDGEFLVEPVVGREELIVVDLDHRKVLEERHTFDPSGHYARPDVLRLVLDRKRQRVLEEGKE